MYSTVLRVIGTPNIKKYTELVFYQIKGTCFVVYSILKEDYRLKA